jgi:hypothetical protein
MTNLPVFQWFLPLEVYSQIEVTGKLLVGLRPLQSPTRFKIVDGL